MVPSKRIAPDTPPETLPEDFSDWDGLSSSATLPAASKEREVREVAPPARVQERVQAQDRVQERIQERIQERTPERIPERVQERVQERVPERIQERVQAPIPAPPAPRNAEKSKHVSTRNSAADSDLEAFLRRLSEVNADIAPSRQPETNHAANLWTPPVQSQAPAPVRQEPAPAPVKAAPVERPLFSSVGSGYESDEETESEGRKKPKWGLIAAVAGGVVVVAAAITIPMLSRGKSINLPHPAAPAVQASGTEDGLSAKPSPDGATSAGGTTNAYGQKPNPAAQQLPGSTETTTQAPTPVPVSSDSMNQQLTASSQLPQGARKPAPDDAPPPSGFGVAGLDGTSDPSAVSGAFKTETKLKLAPLNVSAGVAGGLLIRRVAPQYPITAKTARISGTVVLAATISKSGFVTNVQVISGPPMLRQSAVDAVKYWQYRPYLLNNQPTEVQTTINVDFNL